MPEKGYTLKDAVRDTKSSVPETLAAWKAASFDYYAEKVKSQRTEAENQSKRSQLTNRSKGAEGAPGRI